DRARDQQGQSGPGPGSRHHSHRAQHRGERDRFRARQQGTAIVKICIFGAGAIGGYLAVELARSGQDVSVVARGTHLLAIRERGLTLRIGGTEHHARIPASDDPRTLGPQDIVISTLKAHQAHESAHLFAPLLGPETPVVTAMNGIPWWY